VTEIGRISVVMHVSDEFIYTTLQIIDYRDPTTKLSFWVNSIILKMFFDGAYKEKAGNHIKRA